jgi:hypothetical protein
MLVIVIGRGSGGTRLISESLAASGVDMGPVNVSGDLVPPLDMYSAVRLAGALVTRTGDLQWDFSRLISEEPSPKFIGLVKEYLTAILNSPSEHKGWKLPETIFAFPWITKMFPEAKYIFWTRDPRVAMFKRHLSDSIRMFGAPSLRHAFYVEPQRERLESWVYQHALVEASPKPQHFLHVHYEDFVNNQTAELDRISTFLGIPLKPVTVDKAKAEMPGDFPNLVPQDVLVRFGYSV